MSYNEENIKLFKAMEAFSYTARIPVTYFDNSMNIIWEALPESKFCTIFSKHDNCHAECRVNLKRALMAAKNINEPYVFMCASELQGIMYSVSDRGSQKGFIMVGPILVSKNMDSAIKKIFRTMPDFREYVNEVLSLVSISGVRSSREMTHIYDVFCDCIFSHRILQDSENEDNYFINNLEIAIRSGDESNAFINLEMMYERAYILNSGNLPQIVTYMINKLKHVAEDLCMYEVLFSEQTELIDSIKKEISSQTVYDAIKEAVQYMLNNWNQRINYEGSSEIISEAIKYIKANYNMDIELRKLANDVHVNASYLSSLFRRETKMTFSQFLNNVRLNEAMNMLKEKDKSLQQICEECGFQSESYFIKLFRKQFKESPGKYRNKYLRNAVKEE